MRHAKYPTRNESFFYKAQVAEIARKHRDGHPMVTIKYKIVGFRNEDPCIVASFSPISKDAWGKNIEQDVRSFFFSIDRLASLFFISVTYDGSEPNERIEEVFFETDFPN